MIHFKLIAGISLAVCAAALPASAFAGTKAEEQAGALLFRDKGCAHCHGIGGTGGKKAPALTDLREKKEWTPEKITGQILNGGQKMQLVAYLRAKHPPDPPPGAEPPGSPLAAQ